MALWVIMVYRKPTHTNFCLNEKLHHHPVNKQSVLSTLVHMATVMSDQDSLQAEINKLKESSMRMVIARNKYVGLSDHLERTTWQWPFCSSSTTPSTALAGCCQSITSK
jgi:hypothetical protein